MGLPLLLALRTPAHAATSRLCWLCGCILGDPETKIATGGFRTGAEVDGQAPGEPLGSAVAGSDAGWLGGVCRADWEPSTAGFILSAKFIFSGSFHHILTSDGLSSAAMGTACSSCRTVHLLSVSKKKKKKIPPILQQVLPSRSTARFLALSPGRKALFSSPRRAARRSPGARGASQSPASQSAPFQAEGCGQLDDLWELKP